MIRISARRGFACLGHPTRLCLRYALPPQRILGQVQELDQLIGRCQNALSTAEFGDLMQQCTVFHHDTESAVVDYIDAFAGFDIKAAQEETRQFLVKEREQLNAIEQTSPSPVFGGIRPVGVPPRPGSDAEQRDAARAKEKDMKVKQQVDEILEAWLAVDEKWGDLMVDSSLQ